MIVTIDGPAGVGKSTVARSLASRLGFEFLDTGAMFRAVALAALHRGIDLQDETALTDLLQDLQLQMPGGMVLLNGQNVSEQIRTPQVAAGSSVVAASAVVRPYLAALQRRIAAGRRMVCEGRDQGTVVFPDATCKFFLTASAEVRAQRRARDLEARGISFDLDQLRRDQEERDTRDANRALAPMRPALDALLLDTSDLTLDEVLARMLAVVLQRLPDGTSC
ncbi:MAG: (d)CMP kinase [Gemmataceae bacterium]